MNPALDDSALAFQHEESQRIWGSAGRIRCQKPLPVQGIDGIPLNCSPQCGPLLRDS